MKNKIDKVKKVKVIGNLDNIWGINIWIRVNKWYNNEELESLLKKW